MSSDLEKIIREKLIKVGIRIFQCRSCGREIIFLKTMRGKLAPITLEMESHFIDCPKAQNHRQDKSPYFNRHHRDSKFKKDNRYEEHSL